MASLYFSGIYEFLSFNTLTHYHQNLKTFQKLHPFSFPILFCLIYITATALSLPGAVFLTLTAGFLFPQPFSTIYVLISATIGATLIFLATRTALEDFLKRKAAPFIKKIEKGFQKNAASYLLFLRLVPLFPFWLVNIAPAFFGVNLFTFVWTTIVGILPGTLVFTFAGEGFEKIIDNNQPFSLKAIFNMEIKLALFFLGIMALIPIIIKRFQKFK